MNWRFWVIHVRFISIPYLKVANFQREGKKFSLERQCDKVEECYGIGKEDIWNHKYVPTLANVSELPVTNTVPLAL